MRFIIFLLSLTISSLTWSQTMKELNHSEKIKYFFDHLTKDRMELVSEFYHEQVDFIDPVGSIKGSEKIKAYYLEMYKNVKSIKFDFSEFIVSGNNVVGVWKMTLITDKLNDGEPIVVDGNSVIRFDENGKATYHRDYFDMGAFIYENVPVLGFIVKKIKNRMKVE